MARALALLLAVLWLCATIGEARRVRRPPMGPWRQAGRMAGARGAALAGHGANASPAARLHDPLKKCEERWRDARLDHFSWSAPEVPGAHTFKQRYYVCSKHWRGGDSPIWFYAGNEADVLLYLNHTGLMFENARDAGALLVFAEHRYYGRSKPFGADSRNHMGWLTAEQAMADYAELLTELKDELDVQDAPVIALGGSYGGMLAAWFRMKYPHIVDGAIAASAPIWNFYGEDPPYDAGSFAEGVTYDATPAACAPRGCARRARAAWALIEGMGRSEGGRRELHTALRLCDSVKLDDEDAVSELRDWLASAFDYLAMGNFPYPSGYMLNGNGELPAFPMRVACAALVAPAPSRAGRGGDGTGELLTALADAVGVFYNYTSDLACYDPGFGPNPETDEDGNFWDYQWCTEMLMPASKDGVNDMFWPEPFNLTAAIENCNTTWGVVPTKSKATVEWGGRRIEAASNIVFSNGLYDPWHGGGVLEDVSDSVIAVIIPEGAHHLDLMFSHPDDPQSVTDARRRELRHMARSARAPPGGGGGLMSWADPLAGHPRYELVRNLGRGSHSTVHLCRDRATGEAVAVKLIQRGWDPGQSKYVERELLNHQELSRSRHPHIVEFREVFLTPSHLGVVMEYVDGENLQQFLANTGGRASEALARFLFQQLVLALDFCHRKGKVSRDVKLANTLLALAQNQLPLVKLCDFGYSKDTMLHSAPASQVGTALFVAPEVMHNFSNEPYDGAQADVWSCGIVLFILLFGRHPFLRPEDLGMPDQQQMLSLFTRTAREEFAMLPAEAATISPECGDLLLRILQTKPQLRVTMSAIQVHPWFKTGLPEQQQQQQQQQQPWCAPPGAAAPRAGGGSGAAPRALSSGEMMVAQLQSADLDKFMGPNIPLDAFASLSSLPPLDPGDVDALLAELGEGPAGGGGGGGSGVGGELAAPAASAPAGLGGAEPAASGGASWCSAPPARDGPPRGGGALAAPASSAPAAPQQPPAAGGAQAAQHAAQQQLLRHRLAQSAGAGAPPPAATQHAGGGGGGGSGGADDDYAAFLVGEDEEIGAELRVSSAQMDLGKLSDLLCGGSQAQLMEGSLWHKICRDMSFRRSLGEADLEELRAMSIGPAGGGGGGGGAPTNGGGH
ncbi:MAG: serine carboxypeptidase S28-domain-containing protein [Monoraphidium minutum]|nr:MAG: serine carboxypeptidase S28-domain-containing protein [Monoraphidium minutum]